MTKNLVVKGDTFKAKGKEYSVFDKWWVNRLNDFRVVIQTLYDNGKQYSLMQSELNEKLYLHRSENIHIFGRKIANE